MTIEQNQKMILAVLVGTLLFCLELGLGVFSVLTLNIGGSVLILFVIGMIAGNPRYGMICTLLTLVAILPLGLILWPMVGLSLEMPDDLLMAIWMLIAILVYRSLMLEESGDIGLAIAMVAFFFIAPIIYVGGIFIGGLGGYLGLGFWNLFEKRELPSQDPIYSQDYHSSECS